MRKRLHGMTTPVKFYEVDENPDGHGNVAKAENLLLSVFCNVTDHAARYIDTGRSKYHVISMSLTTHYYSDLVPGVVAEVDGEKYQVVAVVKDRHINQSVLKLEQRAD